ncbi:MAG: hypothetical protein MAG581_02391 [Deltaproteobacteria bacterium]|jgi:ectoine hydroxylase-related dioxygenase (phytanoyl-CoA dioxygenase family)|nr:hypothetical protein [Deltaproteobacteria bacterium]
MKDSQTVNIRDQQVETFSRDGVVILRNMFSADWIRLLKAGIARNLAEHGERTRIWDRSPDGKYTLYDSDNWGRIDEYRKFVFESSIRVIASRLLNTSKVNFFFEAVFIRSDGVQFKTPWHQDEPYWSVEGFDTVSIWMPLMDVKKKSALSFVPGSHRWDKKFKQQDFGELNPDNQNDVYKVKFDSSWEPMPDIDSDREKFNVVSWDMSAGDCVAFNGRIIHGGSGQLESGKELQVFNTQWLGDDVKVNFRSYGMDPDHSDKMRHYGMNTGDTVDGSVYPEFNILR